MARHIVWVSCGMASAALAKIASQDKLPELIFAHCDTLAYEHPDNKRFLTDVSNWIASPIITLKSEHYTDIYDVFDKTKYLMGPKGARCTTELKKKVRLKFSLPNDIHLFGYTRDELSRIEKFERTNPELYTKWLLRDKNIWRLHCKLMLEAAKIELPAMYKLGYKNNNCIGCVKGQAGYWNKIRKDFPEIFEKMSKMERKLNVAINKTYKNGFRERVFLDELPLTMGRMLDEPEISCGPVCGDHELTA